MNDEGAAVTITSIFAQNEMTPFVSDVPIYSEVSNVGIKQNPAVAQLLIGFLPAICFVDVGNVTN
jgi:hypothetical protein